MTEFTQKCRRRLWCAEVAAAVAIAALAFALCGMVCGLQLAASLMVAYALPAYLYRRMPQASPWGSVVLLAAAVVLAVGVTINVYGFSIEPPGASLSEPLLENTDAFRYYNEASRIYEGKPMWGPHNMPALSYATAGLWLIFGKSIVYPLAFNAMLTLLAIAFTGRLTQILLRGKIDVALYSAIATLSMALTAAVCYFLGQGMLMLKEPLIYVATLLMATTLAQLYHGQRLRWQDYIAFVAGCAIMSIARTQFFGFIVLGLLVLAVTQLRMIWKPGMALMAVVAVFYIGGTEFTRFSAAKQQAIVMGDGVMNEEYLTGTDDNRYDNYKGIVGDYYNTPLTHRIVMLPVAAVVQYVVPFPWNFERDLHFGYSQAYNHVAYPWYVVGGIILFYYLFLWWRRHTPLRLWALWLLMCWLVVAYLYAGSVSRYVLPFVPLMVPMAVWVLMRLRAGDHRRTFAWWGSCYVAVMAVGLIACYIFQH